MEAHYPLCAYVCGSCFLVQVQDVETPERIFSGQYPYFSSYSETWVEHARRYAELMITRFGFDASCQVVEIASNDGYLLRHFRDRKIPVVGIEPAENCAKVAQDAGIPTMVDFFGARLAQELVTRGMRADLLVGNNVLAHVPDLNDFVRGLRILLKPGGIITMEFPHLLNLLRENQFDTIYHEHFSYFSLWTVENVFARHELRLFDVEQLPTHGGSLRIYASHRSAAGREETQTMRVLRAEEAAAGIDDLATYADFAKRVYRTKRRLLEFLIHAKDSGKSVVAYGAPAKGNTLLNFCGIGPDLVDYTVDRSPHKQGKFLPGSRIPILHPDRIRETRPDYLLILPWNLKDEVMAQMSQVRSWGGRFVTAIPEVSVIP
jgi:SAM-dependent methyltransferase